MCDVVEDGTTVATNRGELRALQGVEPVSNWQTDPQDTDCLCCVDVEATLALASAEATYDVGWGWSVQRAREAG